MNKLKVLIITQNDPFFIPKMIQYIYHNQGTYYEIIGITVLKPYLKGKHTKDWIFERFRLYSKLEFLLTGCLYVYTKVHELLFSKICDKMYYSVGRFCRNKGIREIQTNSINSATFIEKVSNLKPSIIVSISSTQIFGAKLLNIPEYGCINAHETLLPLHRGVFGTWWTLFCDDKYGGTTIHEMVEKVDAGRIIKQQKVRISQDDSQFSLAFKAKSLSAYLIVQVLQSIQNRAIRYSKMNLTKSSYHYVPTRDQARVFRKKGLRVIRMNDIRSVLGRSLSPLIKTS